MDRNKNIVWDSTHVITAQARAGNKLSAVFLPVFTDGELKGKPVDGRDTGFRTFMGRAMCIFQNDRHHQNVPQESMFLQAPMTITAVMMSLSPLEVSGYQGLYGQ